MSIRSKVMEEIMHKNRHFFRLPLILNGLKNFVHLLPRLAIFPSGHFKLSNIKIRRVLQELSHTDRQETDGHDEPGSKMCFFFSLL
jgi:hypothetical protein